MDIKRSFQKITEMGVGAIAIGALVLAGCGGGGGGISDFLGGPGSTALSVVALLGQFSPGAHVRVKDNTGTVIVSGVVDTSGQVKFDSIPAKAAYPLLVEAGANNDTYFDEHTGAIQTISVAGNAYAIRAFVPSAAVSQVGVTTLTEIAAGGLVDSSGAPLTGITPASAIGANTAVGQMFGIADPTIPPTIVSGVGATNTVASLGSTIAADQYALKLAALSNMAAASGVTAQAVAQQLSVGLNINPATSAAPTLSATAIVTSMQNSIKALASLNTNATAIANAMSIPAAATTLSALTQGAALVAQNALTSDPSASLSSIIAAAQLSASSVAAAISNGTSPASAVANTGTALTAVNDLIAAGMSSGGGLRVLKSQGQGLQGAASSVTMAEVTTLTAGSTAGTYIATKAKYQLTNGAWTSATYGNYVLTASGWVLGNDGVTAVNNYDGTVTMTDNKYGTYTVNVLEENMTGMPLYGYSGTPPSTSTYPAGSSFFEGMGGVSSQDSYQLWSNGGVTNMSGVALTSLPVIGTDSFCANGYVFTPITPKPASGDNYNLMGVVFGLGGCTATNISSVTTPSSIPVATVLLQTKATGINSTNVIIATATYTYNELNNCILGVAGGAVQVGCPTGFNVSSGGVAGFIPAGSPITSAINLYNKTAMDKQLLVNSLPSLP